MSAGVIDLEKDLEHIKKADLNGYNYVKTIGSGSFGVAKLYQKDSKKIVIKEFIPSNNQILLELIKREIINQSECHKENLIVPFLGISFVNLKGETIQIPLLVTEYEEGGSLTNLDKASIDDSQKMIIIYGIAKGIQYLHHFSICHRDLNPNNIVLDSHKYPLICDFGASRQISMVHIDKSKSRGTPLYFSPEMFQNDGITTDNFLPSDVFSFGVIIYNLLTNKQPYSDEVPNTTEGSLKAFLTRGYRMGLPTSIPSWFRYLIILCWDQDPNKRPSIDDIVNLFDAGILLPSIFNDHSQKVKYFEYLNNHLHLNIREINEGTLLNWQNRLIENDKKKLALVINFILADFFGNSDSQIKLGYFYFNEILVKGNINKSIEYFKKAAEKENPKSLFYLSEIYRFGIPENEINDDPTESNHCLQLAVNHGYQPAIEYMNKEREFSSVSKENAPTIVVIGESEAGKTSFINKMLQNNQEDPLLFPSKTIRSYYLPMTLDNNQKTFIRVLDTPDLDYLPKEVHLIPEDTILVILIFDKTKNQTYSDFNRYIDLIRQRTKSKIMILGNKIDLNNSSVSYQQGKSISKQFNADYFEISVLNSTNIEMVLDSINSYINKANKKSSHEEIKIKHFCGENPKIKIIIVGSSSCGKTSFINRLENKSIHDGFSTVLVDRGVINFDLFSLDITDTAGQERYRSLIYPYFRDQQIFIIMFDITSPQSFEEVDKFYEEILYYHSHETIRILLFGNKFDLEANRAIEYNRALEKANSLNAEYIEISCENGYNFNLALSLIQNAYNSIPKGERIPDSNSVDINQKSSQNNSKKCGC